MDTIKITVLEDGTIKTETDRVSMPNHANAEGFLGLIARLCGGKTERRAKHGHAFHSHGAHEHSHEHGDHTHSH